MMYKIAIIPMRLKWAKADKSLTSITGKSTTLSITIWAILVLFASANYFGILKLSRILGISYDT